MRHVQNIAFLVVAATQVWSRASSEDTCLSLGDPKIHNGFFARCNQDGGGASYSRFYVSGFKACIDRCKADPQCQNAGYYETQKECYLKRGTLVQFPPFYWGNHELATRLEPGSCQVFGDGNTHNGFIARCEQDGGGEFYSHTSASSITNCIDQCKADPQCQTAGYYGPGKDCYLKKGTLAQFPAFDWPVHDLVTRLGPESCQVFGDGRSYNGFLTKCGHDAGGPFYNDINTTSFQGCIDECKADPRCQTVGFWNRGLRCYMKEGTSEEFPAVPKGNSDFAARLPTSSPALSSPTRCPCWVTEYDDDAIMII